MDKPLSRAIKKVQRKKITEINKAMLDVAKGAQTLANVAAKAARGEKGGPEADRMSRTHSIANKKPMTASYNYGLEEEVPTRMKRRNVRSPEFRTNGKFDQEKYDAAKARKLTKKGGGRPRKKGGPLATTKGSSVQKTGSSAMTTTNKNTGVTKAEPEAKDQTIDVKATRVNGEIEKSKVGSMPNSGKKEVDPKKNTSITKVGKQNDNSKTYSDNERKSQGFDDRKGRYSDTPRKNEQERQKKREKAKERLKNIRQIRKKKRIRLAKNVAGAAVGTAKKVGSIAKSGIRATTSNFGTSSFSKEEITFKDYLNKL